MNAQSQLVATIYEVVKMESVITNEETLLLYVQNIRQSLVDILHEIVGHVDVTIKDSTVCLQFEIVTKHLDMQIHSESPQMPIVRTTVAWKSAAAPYGSRNKIQSLTYEEFKNATWIDEMASHRDEYIKFINMMDAIIVELKKLSMAALWNRSMARYATMC